MRTASRPPIHHSWNRWPYFRVRCPRLMPILWATSDFVGRFPCFTKDSLYGGSKPSQQGSVLISVLWLVGILFLVVLLGVELTRLGIKWPVEASLPRDSNVVLVPDAPDENDLPPRNLS